MHELNNLCPKRTVLYMEDDPDDVELFSIALNDLGLHFDIIHAWNGEDGLKQLRRLKENNSLPCCILMDINMPRINGKEAYIFIREDKELASIPVVVLSTSTSKLDKAFFEKFCVPFLPKAGDMNIFKKDLNRVLKDYSLN